MAKEKDPVAKLIGEITELASNNKGAVLGAIIGYLASSTIEEHPEIRNAILGAVAGETTLNGLQAKNREA